MVDNKDIYSNRVQELEDQFSSLEGLIEESPVKKALSVLHGMIQETWREIGQSFPGQQPSTGTTFADIVNMYRSAPKMESEALNTPLSVGTPAPDFELPDKTGRMIKLSDYKGKKVLLVFYPLDWSPGCSQQLDLYQSEHFEFEKRGVQILGISVDSVYSHGAWAAVRDINFPLLADFNPKGETAKKYNLFREPEGYSERALFLVDEKGIIQYSYISPFLHHVPDIYDLFNRIDQLETLSGHYVT